MGGMAIPIDASVEDMHCTGYALEIT